MAYTERNSIHQSSRELGNGETLYTQYSHAAAMGRMAMAETLSPEQFGIFTYNLRTNWGHTSTNRQFRFVEDNDTLANILLEELVSQDLDVIHPSGYPEVAAVTQDIHHNSSPVDYKHLEYGQTYLHTSRNHFGGIDHRLFRFNGLEEREDGYGAPFTAVTYIPKGLADGEFSTVVFTEDQYQPSRDLDPGSLYTQTAAAIYGDSAVDHLTANHYMILPTQHAFRHISHEAVNTIVNLCEPEWPPFLSL